MQTTKLQTSLRICADRLCLFNRQLEFKILEHILYLSLDAKPLLLMGHTLQVPNYNEIIFLEVTFMSLSMNILIMCCVWDTYSFKFSYFLYVTILLSFFHTIIYVANMYTVIAYLCNITCATT